jgi:hypothetical protein
MYLIYIKCDKDAAAHTSRVVQKKRIGYWVSAACFANDCLINAAGKIYSERVHSSPPVQFITRFADSCNSPRARCTLPSTHIIKCDAMHIRD